MDGHRLTRGCVLWMLSCFSGRETGATRLLVGDMAVFTDGLGCAPGEPGLVLGLDALRTLPQVVLSTKKHIMLLP